MGILGVGVMEIIFQHHKVSIWKFWIAFAEKTTPRHTWLPLPLNSTLHDRQWDDDTILGYISRANPSFSIWWPFTSPPSQIKRAGKHVRTKSSCSGPSAGHEALITVWYIEWFLYSSIKHCSEGQKGPRRKKLNLDPSSEVCGASPFVSLLKLSLLFRAVHLHMVQSEFPHTWCENGLRLSMKALIMHWNLRRSCNVTAPAQNLSMPEVNWCTSQISHICFSASRSKSIRASNKITVLKFLQ